MNTDSNGVFEEVVSDRPLQDLLLLMPLLPVNADGNVLVQGRRRGRATRHDDGSGCHAGQDCSGLLQSSNPFTDCLVTHPRVALYSKAVSSIHDSERKRKISQDHELRVATQGAMWRGSRLRCAAPAWATGRLHSVVSSAKHDLALLS